ncbi:hypothetical protein TRVA0_027S00474 [Trichomonascus vanleenenianus]|uniref:WD40 repeat domain-containing protein n=1 Tax=Trichomonascus vanleenenianus TaxID=2268995 RepID=UPI003ECB1308
MRSSASSSSSSTFTTVSSSTAPSSIIGNGSSASVVPHPPLSPPFLYAHLPKPPSDYHGFDLFEATGIVIQSLQDLGYAALASDLSLQSGIVGLKNSQTADFEAKFGQCDWLAAESAYLLLAKDKPGADILYAKYLLRRLQFFGLLYTEGTVPALEYLRTYLTPLKYNRTDLHRLAALAMGSKEAIEAAFASVYSDPTRQRIYYTLVDQISELKFEPPPKQLGTLLNRLKKYKLAHSPNRFIPGKDEELFSLEQDPLPITSSYRPSAVAGRFHAHGCESSEVWCVDFSNRIDRIAVGYSNGTLIVIRADDMEGVFMSHDADAGLICAAWSPDGQYLATGDDLGMLRVFEYDDMMANISENDHMYEVHRDSVCGIAWLPDGKRFISASTDRSIHLVDVEAGVSLLMCDAYRPVSIDVSQDGRTLFVASYDSKVYLLDVETCQVLRVIRMPAPLTHIKATADAAHFLVSMDPGEIFLFSTDTFEVVQQYQGASNDGFIVRPIFLGPEDQYVACGSADAGIIIWNRHTGAIIDELHGHAKLVNCLSWSAGQNKLVSGSDDGMVIVWR